MPFVYQCHHTKFQGELRSNAHMLLSRRGPPKKVLNTGADIPMQTLQSLIRLKCYCFMKWWHLPGPFRKLTINAFVSWDVPYFLTWSEIIFFWNMRYLPFWKAKYLLSLACDCWHTLSILHLLFTCFDLGKAKCYIIIFLEIQTQYQVILKHLNNLFFFNITHFYWLTNEY